MPFAAWLRIPQVLRDRFTHRGNNRPWIVPEAVSFLAQSIRSEWNVFEFGSGWSTSWYAERTRRVISLEHDPSWYDCIAKRLSEHGVSNCDLRLVKLESFPKIIKDYEDNSFNLVIVDCSEEGDWGGRLSCVSASVPKVVPGGYLVLDDSDRPAYREIESLLPGWTCLRFVGLKSFPLHAVETTIFLRPLI